jgi:two-component system sensor histidine kinase KdpD
MRKRILKVLASIFGPLGLIGLTTLILLWLFPILSVQNIALLYLLPVMISTVLWGLTAGILAGFLVFLAINYFFIKPYNTLLVHESQDLITLAIFLVVAFVFSQLIGQARNGIKLARTREWEATRMYELIATLSALSTIQSIEQVISEKITQTFRFEYVEVKVNDGKSSEKGYFPTLPAPSRKPEFLKMMTTQRGEEGTISIWHNRGQLSDEENRLLDAYSNQAALAIERIRLTEGETKLRVLEESDRLKTSLLNSVSHELRSPLAAIKASISSLRSGAVDWSNPARQDLVAMIDEESDRLNLLVGNLLDMSRIESGSLKPNLRWNSISEIALGVIAKMASQLHDYVLKCDFPDDLPLIPSDYVMLEQVFTNLISNSVKYAPSGSEISLSAKVDGDSLKVMVKNQSPHVDEENLEHIFDKFFRVTQADKIFGTGLGLSICKGIVEAHGGRIWAENVADGFVFIYTLPLLLNGNSPQPPQELVNG